MKYIEKCNSCKLYDDVGDICVAKKGEIDTDKNTCTAYEDIEADKD